MKADFGKNSKKRNRVIEVQGNGFEEMMKARKEQLPALEDSINEVLKDYDGGSIAIVMMKEDENGQPIGHQLFVGGVGTFKTQIQLGKALVKASDEVVENIMDAVKSNPQAMGSVIGDMLELMGKDFKKGKN